MTWCDCCKDPRAESNNPAPGQAGWKHETYQAFAWEYKSQAWLHRDCRRVFFSPKHQRRAGPTYAEGCKLLGGGRHEVRVIRGQELGCQIPHRQRLRLLLLLAGWLPLLVRGRMALCGALGRQGLLATGRVGRRWGGDRSLGSARLLLLLLPPGRMVERFVTARIPGWEVEVTA